MTMRINHEIEDRPDQEELDRPSRVRYGNSNRYHHHLGNVSHHTKTTTATTLPSSSPTTSSPTLINIPHYDMDISISQDAHILGEVETEYISTTLDWWALGTEAWGNASVINADLSHPSLIAAAKGLGPFFLRIGGSQADSIIYNIPHSTNSSITDEHNIECKRKPQKCLTKERWDDVLNFANLVGARILFTIAYIRNTKDGEGNNDKRDWESTNARQFLEYTAKSPHAKLLYGLELGNELRHKGKVSNRTRIAKAYHDLGQLVDEIWSTDELKHHKPRIAGPASTGKEETAKLIEDVGPYIQIASYHKYHGGGKDPELQPSYSHPVQLGGPGEAVTKYMPSNSSQLWIGEGAMAYNSGRRNITDSFHGTLWFSNLLGSLAKTKPVAHNVYCRQALLGGYYELISHETLIPNPDFWLAYIWKQLVGTKAIGPIESPQREDSLETASSFTFGCCEKPGRDSLLIHSFCGKSNGKDVVYIIINISPSKSFNLNVTRGEKRTAYLLTPYKDGLKSRQVLLNGKLMSIENGLLPDIMIAGDNLNQDELINVPPISITFLVVRDEVKVCRH